MSVANDPVDPSLEAQGNPQEKQLMDAASEYDQLYAQLTSAESRKAADNLFAASTDDLRRTYKPERTETP